MIDSVKQADTVIEYSYEEALDILKDEIDKILSASPKIIREYTMHLGKSFGKLMRAKSILICAENKQGFVLSNAVILANAIELLHLATLVHDDVIDKSDMRRGKVTLQKKYGNRIAVICGDYLLSVALKMVAAVSDKEKYLDKKIPDFVGNICLGELRQQINNGNYNLSVFQYLRIISGKTACMFKTAFYAGASLVEEDEIKIRKYAKIGHYLGMIFQLTDDCMDFETTETIAKKPVQSDYEKDVITLPLIHTFKVFENVREKAKIHILTRSEINKLVKKSGGLLYTRKLARKYYKKAIMLIQELEITEQKRERIVSLLDNAYRVF
ncbi:MAG: polyprenyl synthetase family protein [Arcobacteraceae bacterium]